MKIIHLSLWSLFLYLCLLPSSFAVDLDIKMDEWKTLDFPNRFPQTFVVSNELSPLYFETGENSDELGEFLINLNKSKVDIDIDADDALKITKLMGMLAQVLGEEELVLNKNYIINVSVSKLFNCVPCTEQLNYLSTLELDKFNRINIFLIE